MIKLLFAVIYGMALVLSVEAKAGSWLKDIDARIFAPSPQLQSYNEGVTLFKGGKADDALAKFQMAVVGEDRSLKARALHNTAVIRIDKMELEPALGLLKQALAFDNDSVEIQENLAWVEEQLNNSRKDQAKDKEQNQEPKNAEEKEKSTDGKSEQQQNAESKKGENSESKEGAEDPKTSKDELTAQGKDKDAAKEGPSEKQDKVVESEDKGSGESKAVKEDPAAEKPAGKEQQKPIAQDSEGNPVASSDQAEQILLTPAEIKQQEAESLLRNIDDKIGRYPLTDTEATGKRGNDGKNW